MTPFAVRLFATRQGPNVCLFSAEFATPVEHDAGEPTAELAAGDGTSYDLGALSLPTAVTWPQQRTLPLAEHRYTGPGPYTAGLRLGGVIAAGVGCQAAAVDGYRVHVRVEEVGHNDVAPVRRRSGPVRTRPAPVRQSGSAHPQSPHPHLRPPCRSPAG